MTRLALHLSLFVWVASAQAAVPPAVGYRQAVVAADHPLASAAGVAVLKQGGNAVDAACATAFALGVVNPTGSGIGGGGFMLLLRPKAGVVVLDFRETAPAAASREMYTKPGVVRHASRLGGLAVAVPGEVLGCATAVQRYGKLRLAKVLAPAIQLARRGFAVGGHLARSLREQATLINKKSPELARLFLPGGKPVEQGQINRRPRLAKALQAIAAKGPGVFYQGWIARDLVQAARHSGGVMTLKDLADYRVKQRAALTGRYRGHTVHTMPPPSSGGVALIETLNILEQHKLKKLGHDSSAHLHLLTEALKHAFADRARHLGDPDFVKVPVQQLTSKTYAATLNGRIGARVQPLPGYGSPTLPRAPSSGSGGTSHISVVDQGGMAVAMTTTINTTFGSMVVGKASGIILNNEMDDFAARPGKPNAFGLVQGEQNTVAPGKRPLSSMSPTIVTREGRVVLVAGASGGPTIITGTVQVISNVLDFGLEAQAAVSRSRVHHQWMPDRLVVEQDLPRDVTDALRKKGHRVKVTRHPFTAVQVVAVDGEGLRHGASDPRKLGAPAGY